MFDYFASDLECPFCGHVCRDTKSDIQTKIRREPQGEALRLGDRLVIDHAACEEMLCYEPPAHPDTFSLLCMWDCPECHAPSLWVRVTIVDCVIRDIVNVPLNEESLRNTNYISDECQRFGWFVAVGSVVHDDTA